MIQRIPLKDLCSIDITDGTHKTPTYADSGYIFLSSKNVTSGEIDWDNVMYIPEELHKELYQRLAPQKDDILLAKNGTTGVAALVDREEIFDIYVSLALIRPDKNKIIPKYLLYAINSESSKRYFNSHLKGVGVPNLHLTHIRETPISVPDFRTQEEIIKRLDKVSDLIAKRRQQLENLDLLVKVRFVEIFGDPVDNPKQWEMQSLSNVCKDIYGGGTPSKSHPEYFEGSIPWVSPKDMKSNIITDSIDHITEEAVKNSSAKIVPKDAVLMVIRSGILKHTLPVAIAAVELTVNQDMKVFIAGQNITSKFLMYYFKAIEMDVLSGVRGVTADNIDFKEFQKRLVIVPPIELQQLFSDFVERTEKTKTNIKESLAKLEMLKKALMQEYFG